MSSEAARARDLYLALVLDLETVSCFFESHDTILEAK